MRSICWIVQSEGSIRQRGLNQTGCNCKCDTLLYARFDCVALELRLQLCTYEDSTKRNEISFDADSFSE